MGSLFEQIAKAHGVPPALVRGAFGRNRAQIDVIVNLPFLLLYCFAATTVARLIWRNYPPAEDVWISGAIMALFLSLVIAAGNTMLGEMWSWLIEDYRISNDHIVTVFNNFGGSYIEPSCSHDLRAVQHISDRICVMYLGEIVELAPARQLYADPLMPYTKALIAAVPVVSSARTRTRMVLAGDIPSSVNPPTGCRFRTRCPYALSECTDIKPILREIKPGHLAACIRIGPEEPDIEVVVRKNIRVQQPQNRSQA